MNSSSPYCTPGTSQALDNLILASAPLIYWPLNDTTPNIAQDYSGNGNFGTYYGGTFAVHQQSLVNDGEGSVLFPGTSGATVYSNISFTADNPTSFEIWFSTQTTSGGWLFGFGNNQTGLSGSYDRILYMTNSGLLRFGYNMLASTSAYNDGNPHQAVVTIASSTVSLYVDGSFVTSASTALANYSGYVRVGGDSTSGWPSSPASF